jgi:citrate lyase gamma subunit
MKTILGALLFSGLSFAQVSRVEIQNFNFNYTDPSGEGVAETFSYQQKFLGQQKVHVEKSGSELHFRLEGVENQEFNLKNAPDFIQKAQTIRLQAFNLSLNEGFSTVFEEAAFLSPNDNLQLKNFSLSCSKNNQFSQLMDQLLSGCTQKMALKAAQFSSSGEGALQELAEALVQGVDARNETKGDVGIRNVELKVSGNKFTLAADIRAQISGRATGTGSISYDQAAGVVALKVSEIKFGYLNVTSQVFEELRKQQSARFQVKQPYLYLHLK